MFRAKVRILCAKEESPYGTDAEPTVASNAIEAQNIKVKHAGEPEERGHNYGDMSPVAPVAGAPSIQVSFTCEVKGSGSVGVAGKLGDLLEACGFSETVSVGSSVVYKPSSGTMKSITVYVYDIPDSGSARLHKITGARGNAKLTLNAGKIAKIDFSYTGKYNARSDVASPGTPTYESTKPPIVESSSFTVNDVTSLVVQELSIDCGMSVKDSPDINSAGGIAQFYVGERKPTGKFSPEAVVAATYDWGSDWRNASQRALSVIVGSTAGNICTISAPKITMDAPDEGDRNNVLTDEISFRCNRNAGNDELEIKFT